MSRDRTTSIPRAVTPRDEALARAVKLLRAEHPEWGWAGAMAEELEAQGKDLAALTAERDERRKTIARLKAWVGGSLVAALSAAAATIYGWGAKDGRAEAAVVQAEEYRARVVELEQNDREQDKAISNLRGALGRAMWALRAPGDDQP